MSEPVRVRGDLVAGGQVLRVALADPPRNVLDGAMLIRLVEVVAQGLAGEPGRHVKAILLTAEGAHFSLGASIAEHSPAEAPRMLARFHAAVRVLLAPQLPIVAAVRGNCLGGGLELCLPALRIVAQKGARLGQPEIKLAAFAPVASLLLPGRVGQARAEELLLTGRVVDADEARAIGLVDEIVDGDPEAAALAWMAETLLPHSASALRTATRAARATLTGELEAYLPALELLYTGELLKSRDAEEGVRAFLEKRAPRWEDA
jgi:cyclohexa-1,5-dienecarbonyl-CoA hydratase